jgi:hypothetical protein
VRQRDAKHTVLTVVKSLFASPPRQQKRSPGNAPATGAWRGKRAALLLSAGLVLLVASPWLLPGYLFGTDWPGPRRFLFPDNLSNLTPLVFVLALAAKLVSAEVAAKVFLLGFLFLAAWLAYRAVPVGDEIPRLAAAILYVFNPFVYGRLHYGQFFVIAAYALLPWIVTRCRALLTDPSARSAGLLAIGLSAVGALDLHILLVAVTIVGGLFIAHTMLHPAGLLRAAAFGTLAAAATVALCLYWLIPFASGTSSEAKAVAHIGASDLIAYRVVADPQLGLVPNLLGLYGFWAEAVSRFPSFKLFVPYWQLALAILLALALIGAISAATARRPSVLGSLRWWVIGLLMAGAVGLVLEIGVADPHVAPLVGWLDSVFPPYRGMRDSGKWAALLAVVYAQLIPLGVIAASGWLRRLRHDSPREFAVALFAGLAIALPLYYGNGLLFGIHMEVRPSQYPAGWYAADQVLLSDPNHQRALFLPWHQYLRFTFIQNVNSVVASPAPSFFSIPTVVSDDPEIFPVPPATDAVHHAVFRLVGAQAGGGWARVLAAYNIKYVLVAREVDWRRYRYLDAQPNLVRVADYGSIVVYRDELLP